MVEPQPELPFDYFRVGPAGPATGQVPALAPQLERLEEAGFGTGSGASFAVRYGRRALVSAAGAALIDVDGGAVVEVADLDPVRRTGLVLGNASPHPHAPLHTLLLGARTDVQVVLLLPSDAIAEALEAGWTGVDVAPDDADPTHVDGALPILGTLRTGSAAFIDDVGLLVVGVDVAATADVGLAIAADARAQLEATREEE